ncbi:hypothetical protein [Marilutibacter spongiae]|uniref:Uncharacterized protein n=1 Tax=Marilutibacter spongiae TaxID=2025720 RepID=A0A7W3TP27_9GAMM|nr:hypothetical protein [Lysobacter spongiae]MBB1061872.1 hypothetical protein [Lysobacter spongiae]
MGIVAVYFLSGGRQFGGLTVDWGTLGTWVSGLGTLVVGVLAWWTSRRATDIANSAKAIAREDFEFRRRESAAKGMVIARLVHVEVGELAPRVQRPIQTLVMNVVWKERRTLLDAAAVHESMKELREIPMRTVETVLDSVHYLPAALGPDLATLFAYRRQLGAIAGEGMGLCVSLGLAKGVELDPFQYRKLMLVVKQAILFAELSIDLSRELQEFIGVELLDHSLVQEVIKGVKATELKDC